MNHAVDALVHQLIKVEAMYNQFAQLASAAHSHITETKQVGLLLEIAQVTLHVARVKSLSHVTQTCCPVPQRVQHLSLFERCHPSCEGALALVHIIHALFESTESATSFRQQAMHNLADKRSAAGLVELICQHAEV